MLGCGPETALIITLSPRLLATLENLGRKQAGEEVDWINIADARELTELGFAERNREGWNITAAGSSALAGGGDDASPSADPGR